MQVCGQVSHDPISILVIERAKVLHPPRLATGRQRHFPIDHLLFPLSLTSALVHVRNSSVINATLIVEADPRVVAGLVVPDHGLAHNRYQATTLDQILNRVNVNKLVGEHYIVELELELFEI